MSAQPQPTDLFLSAPEAETYVDQLKIFSIKDIGNASWLQQHEFLEKLNIQAHVNVSTASDEFVKEFLIVADKLPVLVHELVAIETWRHKVYPHLVALDFAQQSTMTPYMVLYHEATLVSLLEAVLYHEEACLATGGGAIDLIDYCMRNVTFLTSDPESLHAVDPAATGGQALVDMTGQEHLTHQTRTLAFDVAVKAVAILRYVTDHLPKMPLSCMTRILNTHDAPCALAALITSPPWTRFINGHVEKYLDGKWAAADGTERLRLNKTEAQVWLAVYNLVMDNECRKKYQYNANNRAELLKLRAHFNEIMLDQLPPLGALRRALEELAVMAPPDPQPSIVLEQVPEIREHLLKVNNGKWAAIAAHQHAAVFVVDAAAMKTQALQFASTYNFDALEALLPDAPKCAHCGEPATKRCSRCQGEWYCRRQCQVDHWKKHKAACDALKSAAGAPPPPPPPPPSS